MNYIVLKGGKAPIRSTHKSVGIDFFAKEDVLIYPKKIVKIPLGVVVKPDKGYYLQLMGRSSLCAKGLIPLAGTIDPDYCGDNDELVFTAYNSTEGLMGIKKGDKVCQGILLKYCNAPLHESYKSFRYGNRNGFGSTGK